MIDHVPHDCNGRLPEGPCGAENPEHELSPAPLAQKMDDEVMPILEDSDDEVMEPPEPRGSTDCIAEFEAEKERIEEILEREAVPCSSRDANSGGGEALPTAGLPHCLGPQSGSARTNVELTDSYAARSGHTAEVSLPSRTCCNTRTLDIQDCPDSSPGSTKSNQLRVDGDEHPGDHHAARAPPEDLREDILPLVYEDEPILSTEDEVEIEVAADTGAVAHVASPKDLPGSVPVEMPEDGRLRNFVAANNTPIKNYGKASVVLEQEDGKEINTDFNVADVSRPLHSVSTICDNEKEMLFTKHGAVVVPEGALSRFLGSIRALARYPRRGGLYVAKMKARKPRTANRPGFTRPGAKR